MFVKDIFVEAALNFNFFSSNGAIGFFFTYNGLLNVRQRKIKP